MTASDRDAETNEPRPIVHEVPSAVSPYIRRIVADNAGPMTGPGTNTYLAGVDEIAIVDPGPDTDEHVNAVAGCGGDRIRWILLTHGHRHHAPATARLKERTGAEVCAFQDSTDVAVDRVLADDDTVETTEFRIRAIHTPGHSSDHLCYFLEEERTLFSGDLVLDGTTVAIAPPDGDMDHYLESLAKVRSIKRLRAIAPGHGHVITDPIERIDQYVDHRLAREAQILDAVRSAGTATIPELVETIYPDLADELLPRAASTVHAHLLRLATNGSVTGSDPAGPWSTA